jgi:hypothetical protein
VTVVPCNINLDTLQQTKLALSLAGTDGTELPLSGSKNISCWESFTLEARPGCTSGWGHACLTPPTTDFGTVNIRSTSGGPFVAVAETFHLDTAGNASSAGVNVFMAAGACSGGSTNLGQACNNDSDCVVCDPNPPFACVPAGLGSCVAPAAPTGGAIIQLPTN